MSNNAGLFDQFWLYPSPVIKAPGSGSVKGAEARVAESSAAGTGLSSGYWGSPTVQQGLLMGGGSAPLLTTPQPGGYHVQVEPLFPGAPFPQATVKGHGQIITGIYFYRKYTLFDQNNKLVPNAACTESAIKLDDPKQLVTGIEIKNWLTDANGNWSDSPSIELRWPMTSLPESFEVIIDQKMWYRGKQIVHDTQRFVRMNGDDVNGVANHSSLTYHEAVPVTILQ